MKRTNRGIWAQRDSSKGSRGFATVRQGLFLVAFGVFGCAGDLSPTVDGSETGETLGPACSTKAYGFGKATECSEVSLCWTESPKMDVNESNCPGCTWSLSSDAAGDNQLSYDDGSRSLYLGFDALTSSDTTEELRQKLYAVNAYVNLPEAEGFPNWASSQVQLRSHDELANVDLQLADGVLRISFSFESTPVTSLLSSTTICGDTNSCSCSFPDIEGTTTIEIELPLPY